MVGLTEEGAALQRRLLRVAEESQEVFLACLSPAEREMLTALLRRMLDADDRVGGTAAGARTK